MNTHANKTKKNKSQSTANTVSKEKNSNKQTSQFVNNRPDAVVQGKLQGKANTSQQKSQVAQFQSMADSRIAQNQQPIQKIENNTGLPDNLKTGMENLSGVSLDDVKVHRNSDKPAQLQAHAYAQGTDIHLGSGQEKHLPHEAWHVVQQKQGRVKPTMQMKGNVNVNDDVGLEKEADIMGAKSVQLKSDNSTTLNTSYSTSHIIQRAGYNSGYNGRAIKDEDAEKAADEPGTAQTLIETGHSLGTTIEETDSTIKDSLSPNSLTADHMEWKGNKKRSDKEQAEWAKKHGHSEKDIKDMKAADATKAAVTGSIDLAIGFMNIPSMIKKFQSAESMDKFEAAMDTADLTAKTVSTGAKIANAADGGTNQDADNTAKISEYTGGIIGSVKNGFNNFKKLKEAYDDYQLIKENDGDASKSEGAWLAFQAALQTAQDVLTNIQNYQKSFGSVIDAGVTAAIPGIGIVMSSISIFSKIISLAVNGNLKVDDDAKETHKNSILADIPDEEQRKKAKAILEHASFHEKIIKAAEVKQLQRDNPEIFKEFLAAKKDKKLDERLKKRYPTNYAKIKDVYEQNNDGLRGFIKKMYEDSGKTITGKMINDIIDDQTLINHLEEVKGKRQKNATIGIFTDLINIGADIATLTGVGAAAGVGMKAGTAAIEGSRKAGNAIKFGARNSGAESFAAGAEGGLFGSSTYDHADILKNDKAKRLRYFSSSRIIFNNIKDHDNKVVALNKPTEKDLDNIEASYKNVCNKIGASGGSVTLVKAIMNSSNKTGNDLIKYFMDKLKTR